MYYFAYGSNMNPHRLVSRVGHYSDLEYGVIKGYKLTFNKISNIDGFGYATIEECNNSFVHGIVYTLSKKAISILDMFEGVPGHYTKHNLIIETKAGQKECIVYIANKDMLGMNLKPTKEYFSHIQRGWEVIKAIE